jgi:UDP-N-acetylglucosamine 2-epimerase (non-hydrolysing)
VDAAPQLERIVAALSGLARAVPVLFPVHPRTRRQLEAHDLMTGLEAAGVQCMEPVGYLDFLGLETGAAAIVTDSGGVQEEASALGVPCFTLRPNTERPVTTEQGTNTLLGEDPAPIAEIRPDGGPRRPAAIAGWDGKAGQRVADVIAAALAPAREEVLA